MTPNRARPDRHQPKKRRHFKEGLEFALKRSQNGELRGLLKSWGLKAERDYVLSATVDYDQTWLGLCYNKDYPVQHVLSFKDPSKATLFKLSWQECAPAYKPISIKFLRRFMPSVIAQDILSVSPTQDPASLIQAKQVQYAKPATSSSPPTSPSIQPDE